jgi:hypothetical protein
MKLGRQINSHRRRVKLSFRFESWRSFFDYESPR